MPAKAWRFAAFAALLPLAACGGSEQESAQPTVKTTGPAYTVQEVDAPVWKSVSAEIATVDQAQAMARIPGILTSFSVKDGDMVRKGQIIGRIVDTQLSHQSGAYGAQAAAAKAQAAQAQAELDRTKFLYQNGVYSKARLDQAQTAAAAARAQVNAAQQQQSAVNAVAGQGAIVAPSSGRVLRADIPAGSAVSPGMSIATITSGPVVLRLELPESLATQVHPGSPVIATDIDGQNREYRGSVVKVYPSVNAGQVRADAQMPGIDNRLVGRRIAAKVESGTHKALLVPQQYVITRYGLDYTYVRGRNGEVAMVPVQTAPAAEKGKVEILSGVSAGDTLVKEAAR
ncbi:hypothetical protein GCM10023219_27070 [Stakelama sediminis]|uniref:RND family efflux transporter MFP subunit n=1 Tax=Stakelama sediminis TaxID=463200 RepID=A0A840YYL8_9SPHN|nr:efflux RND transporter periplasmic adaptor subunit [Stakelama sediminis]MBB5718612.1 RND family efflux transporter MFP subunit [Stakelama sediminis]